MGFEYWKVLECTHDYNQSSYYQNESSNKKVWEKYDAFSQTKDAQDYIKNHKNEKPFFLMLSWGPPHNPYETAPEKYQKLYNPENIMLSPNGA